MKKAIVFLFTAIICLLSAKTASAIAIYPAIFEYDTAKDKSISDTFQIYNESDKNLALEAEIENFTPKGELGEQNFIPGFYGLAKWISLSKNKITLAPKEKKYISFKINPPLDAAPGSYSAGILWRESANKKEGISITSRVGAIILLTVDGDTMQKISLAEFSVSKNLFEKLPIDFIVRIANEGNALVKPMGEIVIKNIFGKTEDVLEINSFGNALLPQSIRRFSPRWDSNKFFIGPFTAELRAKYGATDKNEIKSKIKFWILPWKMIILIFIAILAIYVFWRFTFGKIKKRLHKV
jgi:hypothetical protein